MSSAKSNRMNSVVDAALRPNCTLLFCLNVEAKSFIYVDVIL
jgi:hypothetical protein